MRPFYIGSKWKKTQPLLDNPATRRWIPETARLSRSRLRDMLGRYGTVFVKPEYGTHGDGVVRVRRLSVGGYEIRREKTREHAGSFERLYERLARIKGRKSYLVQQGIPLLKYKGRRFDIRVMVQTNPQRQWETTAMVGRVAAKRQLVTNYYRGGELKSLETLLAPHMSREAALGHIRELRRRGETIASVMHRRFPSLRELGVDIGMDQNLTPWVIEVNTMPNPYIFHTLPDKSIQRKVLRYARAYGRIKSVRRKT